MSISYLLLRLLHTVLARNLPAKLSRQCKLFYQGMQESPRSSRNKFPIKVFKVVKMATNEPAQAVQVTGLQLHELSLQWPELKAFVSPVKTVLHHALRDSGK